MGKSDITSKIKVHEIRLPEQALLSLPIPYFPSPNPLYFLQEAKTQPLRTREEEEEEDRALLFLSWQNQE